MALIPLTSVSTTELGFDDRQLGIRQIGMLVGFGVAIWLAAALFIRYRGPAGTFDGVQMPILYGLTIPAAWLANRRGAKLAKLPRSQTYLAAGVVAGTGAILDGIVMVWVPAFYGGDPKVILGGATWLLWAVGVTVMLGLTTSLTEKQG